MSLELGNDEGTLIYQLKAILYFGVLFLYYYYYYYYYYYFAYWILFI